MASVEREGTSARGASAPAAGSGRSDAAPAPAAPEEVALDQLFHGENLFSLRSAVAAHASALGLSNRQASDLVLVAHELAANAVRHGGASRTSPGRLRLWREATTVICQVTDGGPGLADPATAGVDVVPTVARHGRGLWIVRQVSHRLHIESGPAGATITAWLLPAS